MYLDSKECHYSKLFGYGPSPGVGAGTFALF